MQITGIVHMIQVFLKNKLLMLSNRQLLFLESLWRIKTPKHSFKETQNIRV